MDVNDHYLPDRHAVRSLESSPLVKEAGLAALMLGWIYFMTGLYDISEIIGSGQLAGISSESKLAILFSGVRVTVIAPTYGMIVYCISLLLRIAVKPRI